MTRTTKLILAGVFASLSFGGVAIAKGGPGGPGGHGGPFGKAVKQLDLSEDQEAEAEALREGVRAEKEAAREAHKAFKEAMLEELATGAPDRARIQSLEAEAQEAMLAASSARTEGILDFFETLTPEQKTELVAELEAAKVRREERRAEGGGEGGKGGRHHGGGEGGW